MFKIKIYTVGKHKEKWLIEALEEYTQRLQSHLQIEWILAKQTSHLSSLLEKESNFIALDPSGKEYSSEQFSDWLKQAFIKKGSRLSFVIGGAEGLDSVLKSRADWLLSLSRLTFTHQITRLILLEQLYRAFEIAKGSSYHK